MTNPRARINFTQPPTATPRPPDARSTPIARPPATAGTPAANAAVRSESRPPADPPEVLAAGDRHRKPLGKAHGRMRSVGVYLTPAAERRLREDVDRFEATLGEVAMHAIRRYQPADEARPVDGIRRRGARPRRNTERAAIVYLLLTPDEAAELADVVHKNAMTVSDLVSRALVFDAGES